VAQVAQARRMAAPEWRFEPVYWNELLSAKP
jgi:leucyl/phenylalanyl-tRNA--protein transferase